jgi:hypothetical protein
MIPLSCRSNGHGRTVFVEGAEEQTSTFCKWLIVGKVFFFDDLLFKNVFKINGKVFASFYELLTYSENPFSNSLRKPCEPTTSTFTLKTHPEK